MEELADIAKAHFQAGSPQVRSLAHQFFDSMDSNGDGRIDLGEFLEFTRQKCNSGINRHSFFKKLDRDGKGTLGFWEVMTLYYIIKSGRPFCSYCDNFIPRIFFSCVGCSFTLCRHCYLSSKYDHNHNGRAQFLDNYTLLKVTRDSAHGTGSKQSKPTTTSIAQGRKVPTSTSIVLPSSTSIVPAHDVRTTTSNPEKRTTTSIPTKPSSTSIVPAHKVKKWKVAFKALEVALAIGNISSTMCTIL